MLLDIFLQAYMLELYTYICGVFAVFATFKFRQYVCT